MCQSGKHLLVAADFIAFVTLSARITYRESLLSMRLSSALPLTLCLEDAMIAITQSIIFMGCLWH